MKRRNMPLGRAIFSLAFEASTLILIFASGMLILENRYYLKPLIEQKEAGGDFDHGLKLFVFHDLIYYTVVTITSTGYGDISPHTDYGQILFIMFFLSLMVVLPSRVQELRKMSSLTSAFGRVVYKGDKVKQHFLVLGDCEPAAIETFFSECFHVDHGAQDLEIVILRDKEPDEKINAILKKPEFDQKVIYIKGSPLNRQDLKRCLTHKATCCIIMSN